jgi:rfaE bifunctional protein nucleotidyltransferase chain/domain
MGREMAEVILEPGTLAKKVDALKSQGRKIVLVDGPFDLLQVGDVRFLRAAKALGDALVLALNSDESLKRVKGEGRPLLPLEDRLGVLSAFEMVDFVIPFTEDSVTPLLNLLRPTIYAIRTGTKAPANTSFGGQTVTLKEGDGHSAEKLIQIILGKYGSLEKKDIKDTN